MRGILLCGIILILGGGLVHSETARLRALAEAKAKRESEKGKFTIPEKIDPVAVEVKYPGDHVDKHEGFFLQLPRTVCLVLPGIGTNYLKQESTFLASAKLGDELTAHVEITRLRPEKHLVDLRTTCHSESGALVCEGRALVYVRDVEANANAE